MLPVPSPISSSVTATDSASITPDSFTKDGRKVQVGDCALFKPPQDAPPFIGIIRRLILGNEDSLSLSVNWLYRPADVKLAKGSLLDAAPNEVFYSFHKDEIPAASLLHPCKVAFLRRGVELPSGISSFICRRLYDIDNKCLWWLTDKDYINERQEEVDQLLDKTQLEMYGAVQSGGRSPKPLNGQTGAQQLKPSSDSMQNSSPSIPSQVKGKKRERVDQGTDPVKRERSTRAEEVDSCQVRPEQMLKAEITKITDKGGLVDFEGVEKLVQLMQPEGAEKKIDLACRIMLVDVIAVTDRFDCLARFVQLRGLPVLDEWLQEVNKGETCDGSNSKESDRTVEEFLLALLRALDKLPVNLHALQTCNVGKSVNHLRTHKNSAIQKKARSLVDTWKKRVEAEMNILDAKSGLGRGGSWPSKAVMSEVSQMGGRRGGGSSEVGVKSSVLQSSASKTPSVKVVSGEPVTKNSSASPGYAKLSASVATSVAASSRNLNSAVLSGGGSLDLPLSTTKEEKSSSSSQSQNNSQSCSSDHAKAGASACREDARSSTAGSVSVNRSSAGVSRSRMSCNGLHVSAVCGVEKESSSVKVSSSSGNFAPDKVSPSRGTCDSVPDVPPVDNGGSQRLIVRLPNIGRSPACSPSGGSPDGPSSTSCKVSSPAHSEKPDHHERKMKGKSGSQQAISPLNANMDLCQGKEALAGSDEANKISIGVPCPEKSMEGEMCEKQMEVTKSLGTSLKPRKLHEASFSSMNALIESCVKFSEASASVSIGDDIGMNLLASVAAGEISRSDADASPSSSPRRKSPLAEDSCSENDSKLRKLDDGIGQPEDRLSNDTGVERGNLRDGNLESGGADNCHQCCSVSSHEKGSCILDSKHKTSSPLADDEKNFEEKPIGDASVKVSEVASTCRQIGKGSNEMPFCSASDICGENSMQLISCATELKPPLEVNSRIETQPFLSGACTEAKDNNLVAENHTRLDVKQNLDPDASDLGNSECVQDDSARKEVSVPHEESSAISLQESKHYAESSESKEEEVRLGAVDQRVSKELNPSSLPASGSDVAVKLDFDLNEGFPVDDGCQGELVNSSVPGGSPYIHLPCSLPSPISLMSGSLPASITVAAAAKGPVVPPENPLRTRGELGWKGSAATSAFRPAEPRKVLDLSLTSTDAPLVDSTNSKESRPLLDIDLNVPDQRVFEDVASQNTAQSTCLESGPRDCSVVGLDLDLNRVDDTPEQFSVSSSCRLENAQLPGRAPFLGGFSKPESNGSRDFDLNNGPGPEEAVNETLSHAKSNLPFLSSLPGVRGSNPDMGNFSSWFPQGSSYPAIAIPSILSSRGDQSYPVIPPAGSQRILVPPSASTPFGHEIYRGPVLTSSPAVAFPSATPFQYPGFPFETNLPILSSSYSAGSTSYVDSSSGGPLYFPPIHTQLVGPNGVVSTQFSRPYVMSLPGATGTMSPESRKWGGPALDLNSGPGATDIERRDERLPSALRQLPVSGSQALAGEQLKMYQMTGGMLKRKEPDGGWDGDRMSYKQPSWQ